MCPNTSIYKNIKIFKIKKNSFIKSKDANLQSLENSIADKIGLNVSIKNKKNKFFKNAK